jgi:uncharacterized protein (DUF1330 family)
MTEMHFHINPTREQFKQLHELDGDQPLAMLNLLRFREQAQYVDDGLPEAGMGLSGRQAYERYSQCAEAAFRRAGGRQLWIGQPVAGVIGPEGEQWDLAFVAWYASPSAFVTMVKSEEYQQAARHRTAALLDSRLIACRTLRAGSSFTPVTD